jgi:hypothetical protein
MHYGELKRGDQVIVYNQSVREAAEGARHIEGIARLFKKAEERTTSEGREIWHVDFEDENEPGVTVIRFIHPESKLNPFYIYKEVEK